MAWMMKLTLLGMAVAAATADDGIRLDGSGTTNPSKFFWEVFSLFHARAVPQVSMSYRAVGSSTGQAEFVGATDIGGTNVPFSDFGSGDIPLSQENYDLLKSLGREPLHFPFLLGAMSVFHNIPGVPKEGPGGLNVTGCLLARIFSRDITAWNDPDILEINEGLANIVVEDEPIKVYHRVKGSSTTAGFTEYLRSSCPSFWPAESVGPLITWADDTFEAQGSGGMAEKLSTVAYSIGYIDSGHGHDDGLAEVELENAAGKFRSSLEALDIGGVADAAAVALGAGAVPSDPTASFADVSLHNQIGDSSWPIVAVSYIYIDADQEGNEDHGVLLKAFLEFLISDEGQGMVSTYNFVALPSTMIDVAQAAINLIRLPGNDTAFPRWTFESSDTTQAGAGMRDYVISAKRRSHFELAIDGTMEDVEAQSSMVSDLEARLNELESRLARAESDMDGDEHEDGTARALAAVAFVLALLGLAIAVYVCCTRPAVYSPTSSNLNKSNGDESYDTMMPPSEPEDGNL